MTNKKKNRRRTKEAIEFERELICLAFAHGFPKIFFARVLGEPTSRVFALQREGPYILVREGERHDPEYDLNPGAREYTPYTEVVGPYRELDAIENNLDVLGVEEHATDHGWSVKGLAGIALRMLGAPAVEHVRPGGITSRGGFRIGPRFPRMKRPGQGCPPPARTCGDLSVPTCQGMEA